MKNYHEGYKRGKLDGEIYWKKEYEKIADAVDRCFPLPMEINESYKILSVEKLSDLFIGYKWEITGIYNDNYFNRYLTRIGDEHAVDLIKTLKITNCPADIDSLNEDDSLNYA